MTRPTRFVARAPVRVDLAGGGTDAPPFCVEHGGLVLNVGIARYVYARVETHPGSPAISLVSEDFDTQVAAPSLERLELDGRLDLLAGVARRMAPSWGFRLSVCSDVMPGTGLGSSGAVCVACVRAFDAATGVSRSVADTAELANAVERNDLGMAGGSQDSYGAAFGGVNAIRYHRGGGTENTSLDLAPATLHELQRRCLLVYTGEVHLSGSIHTDIRRSYALPNSPTVDAMKNLAKIAEQGAQALTEGDVERFGELLSANWHHHKRLHQSCTSARLEEFYAAAAPHVVGGKTCGAGGGGWVLFLARDGHRHALERACRELGGTTIPLVLDTEGALSWVPRAG